MNWSRKYYTDAAGFSPKRFNGAFSAGLPILFWLGCLFLFNSHSALGYVIDGSKVLELTARQIGRADTLTVTQNLTTYVVDEHTKRNMAEEDVRYIFPNIFRVDSTADGVQKIFLASDDLSLAVINSKVDSRAESELDLYHYLLLQHYSSGLTNFLEAYGIDTTISSLGKFEKKVAYVVGAQYPNQDNSQLWIDKATLLPMRWILVIFSQSDQNSSDKVEVDSPVLDRLEFRFSLWQKFGKLNYPKRIDIFYNDILQREVRVNDVKVDLKLDEALMDIAKQRALYPENKVNATDPQNDGYEINDEQENSIDDIQKTIDNFNKKFE
jgi:hypothetical protein